MQYIKNAMEFIKIKPLYISAQSDKRSGNSEKGYENTLFYHNNILQMKQKK